MVSFIFALTGNKLFVSERSLDVSDDFLDAFNQKNVAPGSFYVGSIFSSSNSFLRNFALKLGECR